MRPDKARTSVADNGALTAKLDHPPAARVTAVMAQSPPIGLVSFVWGLSRVKRSRPVTPQVRA